ncbi:MAG: hypothetical protein V3U87_03405 [Methylococcaceae bacterium]
MHKDHTLESIAEDATRALKKLKLTSYKEVVGFYKQALSEVDNDQLRLKFSGYIDKAKVFNLGDKYTDLLNFSEKFQEQEVQPIEQAQSDIFEDQFKQLIQSGDLDQIQVLLNKLSIEQVDKQYPAQVAVIGLLMLIQHPEFEKNLPKDSTFITDFKVAQKALQAFQANDLKMLKQTLKFISFRSAFKDFRIILNAVLAAPSSIEKMELLLGTITDQSPYYPVANLLLAYTKEGADLFKDLVSFDYEQQNLIGTIKGFNDQQQEFIAHLLRQYDDLSEKIMFSMAIQYQALFGSALVEQFCQTLLISYPAGYEDYIKSFGSVNEFEALRIKALTCEKEDNFYDADYYWRQSINQLKAEEGNEVKVALILHHIAQHQQDEAAKNDCLIESLQYDPDSKDNYLSVLNFYAQQQHEKYHPWLAQGLEKFPQDSDILNSAIKTVSEYKDVIQYAKMLLQIDPLNSLAKQTLFSAHLDQAKQFLVDKKYSEVEQELEEIDQLKLGKANIAKSKLLQGFFNFIQSDKAQGHQEIIDALQFVYEDSVNLRFKASMEALIFGLSELDISIQIDDGYLLAPDELVQLSLQIEQYKNEQEYLPIVLNQIKPILIESLQQQTYDETLCLNLAQQLDSIQQYELLNIMASQALDKWKNPVWVYYQVLSATQNQAEECSYINLRRLQKSLEQAREEKNQRCIILIDEFLNQYKAAHPGKMTQFFQKLFLEGKQQTSEDPLETLFGNLSDKILLQLSEPVDTMSKQTTLEQLSQVIRPDDNALVLAMMQTPDLYNALIVVKAAEQSGVNIDANIDKVFECFGFIFNKVEDSL